MNLDLAQANAKSASKNAGVSLTPKRANVLSLLLASKVPLSAYELAELLKAHFNQSIPAMSVYRMLDFLTQNNLAHKLESENKFVSCSHSQCDHEHGISQFLICGQCHEVKEIEIPKAAFNALEASVSKAGFALVKPQLELKCLCSQCSQAPNIA